MRKIYAYFSWISPLNNPKHKKKKKKSVYYENIAIWVGHYEFLDKLTSIFSLSLMMLKIWIFWASIVP